MSPSTAQHAFEEHPVAGDDRRVLALDAGIGNERHGGRRVVLNALGNREDIFVINGNLAGENQARAIVPGERHGLAHAQHRIGGRLPQGFGIGQLGGGAGGADKTLLGKKRVGGSGGREQDDGRALGIDGLAVTGEMKVIKLGARAD